jgi:excisionase family DNA binding protein
MTENRNLKGTLGNDEASAFLGCTPGTLRVGVAKRRVPFVKIGRLTRFLREDLEDFVRSRRVPVHEQLSEQTS